MTQMMTDQLTVAIEPDQAYRFPREPGTTPAGYPLPLSGKPITETPVIIRQQTSGALMPEHELKQYPEYFVPDHEELASNEIRITCLGSGMPWVRKCQASSGWLVELGNRHQEPEDAFSPQPSAHGDKFLFDVGSGTIANLWALEIEASQIENVLLGNLHIDHIGDLLALVDAGSWGRCSPLNIWGPSGFREDLGTAAAVHALQNAVRWALESKKGHIPDEATRLIAHEFDFELFTPNTPSQLIYNSNGVIIEAFPVIHALYGAVAYRLAWNDTTLVFVGDSQPSQLVAEQSRGADILVHEMMLTPETFAEKMNVPIEQAEYVVYGAHTPPDMLGELCEITRPGLAIATHYPIDDDTIDSAMLQLRTKYDGPALLAQDLTVINVTPQQIVSRMALVSPLAWPVPHAPRREVSKSSDARIPRWIADTWMHPPHLDPQMQPGMQPTVAQYLPRHE